MSKKNSNVDKVVKKTKKVVNKVKKTAKSADIYVKEHPYKAGAMVAGVSVAAGMILGWLIGRKK